MSCRSTLTTRQHLGGDEEIIENRCEKRTGVDGTILGVATRKHRKAQGVVTEVVVNMKLKSVDRTAYGAAP